ncbi:MAG TPA: class I SAM-dependent methyltransferase [Bryobacteraceae bacterium]|jgi:SAM-dependent methyltransferase|nr:class I SAM-dependent methyltransferase [Bryobacteraceae bacterium]
MTNATNTQESSRLNAAFLEEYNSEQSVQRYTRKTAGHGIGYLLDHEYGRIYLDSIKTYLPKSRLKEGIRIWEFGCGGGMNLLHLTSAMRRKGIGVNFACGTDFSQSLIAAARKEASSFGGPNQFDRVRFTVARNEALIEEAAKGLEVGQSELAGSFDLVFGVNTIRYAHRLDNVDRCVDGIRRLLRKGGLCIIIDMNRKFPAFRSRFRDVLKERDEKATLLPTLDEYAAPFFSAGFEVLKKENFCWIPHSAGTALTGVMRALTPALNVVARSHSMRSLVIARRVV